MNYCLIDQIATEACECYENTNKLGAYQVCQPNQGCVDVGKEVQRYVCQDACKASGFGPCACRQYPLKDDDYSARYADDSSACVAKTSSSSGFSVEPIAQIGVRIETFAACRTRVQQTEIAVFCEGPNMCAFNENGTVNCVLPCAKEATALEKCHCIDQNAIGHTAEIGQYCTATGAVRDLPENQCAPDSISAGNCTCPAETEKQCEKGNYCTGDSPSEQTCLLNCGNDQINQLQTPCACRTANGVEKVKYNAACTKADYFGDYHYAESLCADGAQGPCACKYGIQYPDYVHARHTPEGYVCTKSATYQYGYAVYKIIQLGQKATVESACFQAIDTQTQPLYCKVGSFCLGVTEIEAACVPKCIKNQTAVAPCACTNGDESTRNYAAKGVFCSENGAVSALPAGECAPNSVSAGNCKCSKNDAEDCASGSFCMGQSVSQQSCYQQCKIDQLNVLEKCACPQAGTSVPTAKGEACVAYAHDQFANLSIRVCDADSIGPCGCHRNLHNDTVRYARSNQACVSEPGEEYYVERDLCKNDVLTTSVCACKLKLDEADKTAAYTQISSACMDNGVSGRAVLAQCKIGVPLASDCACKALSARSGSAAFYCAAGNVCYGDPRDPAKNVCWTQCGDANSCPDGKKCLGADAATKRCVGICKADEIVAASEGCVCDSPTTPCEQGGACVSSNCVQQECQINQTAGMPCFCMLDGTRSRRDVAYTAADQACVETDAETRTNAVSPLCSAETRQNCACRLESNAPAVAYCGGAESCVSAYNSNNTNLCAPVCTADADIEAECACGGESCPSGKVCTEQRKCVFRCAQNCAECPDAPDRCTRCARGYKLDGVMCVENALSAGAIAGIAVGCVAGAAVIAVGVWMLVKKLGNGKKGSGAVTAVTADAAQNKAVVDLTV